MGSSALTFVLYKHHLKFVEHISQKYSKLFSWSKRKNINIMDIGSGPGKSLFTMEPILPKDYSEIVCVDKDIEVCEYLKTLEKDPRISIRHLDIETKKLPEDLKGRFDLLISSYCFSYVVDFRQAFHNSTQLLKPGGELFFFWSKKNQLYEAYRTLSYKEKWEPYLSEFKNWTHSYSDDNAPEALKRDFNKIGLQVQKIEEFEEETYENENVQFWLDAFFTLDKFTKRIPKSECLEYKEEMSKLLSKYIIMDEKANNTKMIFPTIVVAAKKLS